MKTYTLSEEDKAKYASVIILNHMINFNKGIKIPLKDDNEYLRPSLNIMYAKDLIKDINNEYVPTEKGKDFLEQFFKRYREFLKIFEVFCAVDLNTGNFGYEKFFDFETDEKFRNYLKEDRWEDMRVAVAEFRKIDPIEMIFMSFIEEGRFECDAPKWQFELLSGLAWKEILEIANNNVHVDQVDPTEMENMVREGSALMLKLIEDKNEMEKREDEFFSTEIVVEETVVDEYEYYEPYYDPFYVSPLWAIPFILLF